MESAPLPLKIAYVLYTKVHKTEKIDDLWYVNFKGSWESLAFGREKPWEVGDKIKITFERVNDDQPKQPSK